MSDQTRTPGAVALPPFAEKVIGKLRRFEECSSDGQGADIGRHWFDLLTQLGLLNRVQRSPALWEMTQQGEDLLEAPYVQPPAVGAQLARWEFSQNETHVTGEGEWVRYDDHRAHVDQFLVEIDSLTQTSFSQEQVIENLETRIAELEAVKQQGEPDPIIAVLKSCLAEGVEPKFSGGDLKHLISLLEGRGQAGPAAAEQRGESANGCGYDHLDWACREGGYLWYAGDGEGYDPEDCSHICPHCRTKDYLEAAKDEAESVSSYSNNGSSGAGVDIWTAAERTALLSNEPAARQALSELGPVSALDGDDSAQGYSVVLCNTQEAQK